VVEVEENAMSKNQHKPAKKEGRKWAAPAKNPYTPMAKQAAEMALGVAGESNVQIARKVGLNRETVTRILSQPECEALAGEYRSEILSRIVPLAIKSLEKLVRKADRVAVIQTLFGMKIFSQRHEMELNKGQLPERNYADAKIKFYYQSGRWPTLEEAKQFDKTIPVKLLLKGPLE
jgi:hypothetical protein